MKNTTLPFILLSFIIFLFLFACDENNDFIIEDETNPNCAILTRYFISGDSKSVYIRNNDGRLDTMLYIDEEYDSMLNLVHSFTYDSNNKILNTLTSTYSDTMYIQYNYSQNKLEKTFYKFRDSVKISKFLKEIISFNSKRFIEKYESYEIKNNTMYQDKAYIYNYDDQSNIKSKESYSNGKLTMTEHFFDYDSSMYYLLNEKNDYFNLKTFKNNPKKRITYHVNKSEYDTLEYFFRYNEFGYLVNMTLDTNNWPEKNLFHYYCW